MLYVCLNDFKISYFSVRVHLLLLKKFAFLCLGQLSSQQPLHFLRAPEDEEKNLLHKRAVGNGRWSSRENIKKLQMEIPEYCSVSMSNVHTEIPMKDIHGILYGVFWHPYRKDIYHCKEYIILSCESQVWLFLALAWFIFGLLVWWTKMHHNQTNKICLTSNIYF